MKSLLVLIAAALVCVGSANAQSKNIDEMSKQIGQLKAEKTLSITHEPNSNSSKLMLVADNFSNSDVSRAGIIAMNFATGFFFPGTEIKSAPDKMQFTFWVMTKKPRFVGDHRLEFVIGSETIAIGEARYAAKANRNMEYLNYEISRSDLVKIANQTNVSMRIGSEQFTFTRSQLQSLASLILVSDPAWVK